MTTRNAVLAIAISATALMTAASAEAAVIYQNDFDGNAQPFTSAYTQVSGPGSLVPEGTYAIGNNPNDFHPFFASFTNGTGNALIVNGATSGVPSDVYTSSSFTATTTGSYMISADIANVCCNTTFTGPSAPSVLTLSTNGNVVATFTTLAGSNGVYPGAGTFFQTSGLTSLTGGTSYILSISNGSGAASGNDFAIDNLSVSSVPEPATWAMMLLGFAGLAFAAGRKQTSGGTALSAA